MESNSNNIRTGRVKASRQYPADTLHILLIIESYTITGATLEHKHKDPKNSMKEAVSDNYIDSMENIY